MIHECFTSLSITLRKSFAKQFPSITDRNNMDYLNDEFFEGLSKEEIEQLNDELCVSQFSWDYSINITCNLSFVLDFMAGSWMIQAVFMLNMK